MAEVWPKQNKGWIYMKFEIVISLQQPVSHCYFKMLIYIHQPAHPDKKSLYHSWAKWDWHSANKHLLEISICKLIFIDLQIKTFSLTRHKIINMRIFLKTHLISFWRYLGQIFKLRLGALIPRSRGGKNGKSCQPSWQKIFLNSKFGRKYFQNIGIVCE